jgi:hypothetical protein
MSTIPVANVVDRRGPAALNAVSSTPRVRTASNRAGSSTAGRPQSVTAFMIVAQPTPNWAASWVNV